MIEWEKPSGVKVETNEEEASVLAAMSLGWVRVEEKAPSAREIVRSVKKCQTVEDLEVFAGSEYPSVAKAVAKRMEELTAE